MMPDRHLATSESELAEPQRTRSPAIPRKPVLPERPKVGKETTPDDASEDLEAPKLPPRPDGNSTQEHEHLEHPQKAKGTPSSKQSTSNHDALRNQFAPDLPRRKPDQSTKLPTDVEGEAPPSDLKESDPFENPEPATVPLGQVSIGKAATSDHNPDEVLPELPPRPTKGSGPSLGLPESLKEAPSATKPYKSNQLDEQKLPLKSTEDGSSQNPTDSDLEQKQSTRRQERRSNPPPYSEEDLLRYQAQHEQALEELDLEACDTATQPELPDSEDDEVASINAPSRSETFKNAYANAGPKIKSAYQTTRHLAGGLVSHPVQSTKHLSVLRHSHGLVAYRGHHTSVAITIFADSPHYLPLDRTIWLQSRGWSGQKGMQVRVALGHTGNWVDVTPQAYVGAEQLRPTDEKAWQRDIAAFLRKASQKPKFQRRRPFETCVVRIPAAAADGYFRLLFCDARKNVLCSSPIFRVISLSSSSASFRGASLRTMPLEIGIKGLTTVAFNAASSGTAPVAMAIQNRFGSVAQNVLTRGMDAALSTVENATLGEAAQARYEAARNAALGGAQGGASQARVVVGDDEGPRDPYPLRFTGKVIHGGGTSNVETGLPTANLSGVREEVKTRLDGTYFGWASIQNSKTIPSDIWRPALILARPSTLVATVAPTKSLYVYVIEDFDGVDFFGAKLSIIVMGFLRAWGEVHPDQFREETAVDILVAKQSLDRRKWQADAVISNSRSHTGLSDRIKSARETGQRQFDRVPFDKVSVRTPTLEMKDSAIGKGGLCISRVANATPQ